MESVMKILGQYLGMLFVLSILAACSGGGSSSNNNNNANNPSTGVSGTITDMSGAALQGATIFVGNSSTLSDSEGQFSLDTDVGDISVTATLLNYTQNNRVVTVANGVLTTQNLKLAVIDTFEEFDANLGATLVAKDASIILPTSYVLEDGSAYTGTVSARATYNKVTTSAGLEAFPGPFLGQETGGDTKILQSYGFIDVTLKNSEGANVNLADSATATLTYPMDENITETPATIPLWYFDTTKGIWVEEGEATYDAVTNTYSGTVTHFSTWNLDKKFDGATLQGCIEDNEGQRVPLADIYISAEGWNRKVVNNDTAGTFEFINAPSGIELSIIAKFGDQSSTEQRVTLASGDTQVMGSCLILDIDSTELFTSVSGKVVSSSSNTPLVNQPVILYSVVEGASVYQAQANTDANGKFGITVKRSDIENIKLSLTKRFASQNLGFNHYYSIDPVKSVTDVGSIKLAATIVEACITLEAGSSTAGGVTTLADGITTVDDGTTIAGSGFTSFGTDERQLRVDGPYGVDYNIVTFNQTGTFSFVFPQDNLTHHLYAHVYDTSETEYTLTGSMSVVANTDSIDLTQADECIELHAMRKANKAVTVSVSSNNPVHLEVSSPSDYHFVNNDPKILSKTFVIDENGEYVIKQVTDSYDDTVSGSIALKIDGNTQTVTIPSPSNSEFWTGFVIESYDGDITVKTINKNYYQ
jgi:hypothetical protein